MLKLFSTELKYYLLMNTFFAFGTALSSIFISVFLWRLDHSYSLLAYYSLYWSIAIIISFGLCAWIARKTTPMITMRLGFFVYLITYLIMLFFHQTLDQHIGLLGMSMGLAISLYSVGMHMAILDLTTNDKRDTFLYVQGILTTTAGVIAPLLSGLIISHFNSMTGYYFVFMVTCLFFILAFLLSFKVKGRALSVRNYFWDVIRYPSKEWRRLYSVMFGDGIVSGAYNTFLVSMMTYKIAGGELYLGIFNSFTQIVSILSFYILARISKPNYRMIIFAIGAISLSFSSAFLSMFPVILGLLIFSVIKPIAANMVGTSMNAMIYAAIEKDPLYKEKRLDYIVVRELPLGFGRILGVLLFLFMRDHFSFDKLLPVSFSLFPLVYVILIPVVYFVWKKRPRRSGNKLMKFN